MTATNTFDPHLASYVYYVVCPLDKTVDVFGFTRKERADAFAAEKAGTVIRHSKQSLADLPMDVLIRVVTRGTEGNPGAPKATQLKRKDLVDAAYGCLSAAAFRTARLDTGDGTPSPSSEEEPVGINAPRSDSVRDMRSSRAATKKSTKSAAAKPAKSKVVKSAKAPGKPREGDEYAGKKLYLTGKENPRRENTHGHKSLGIILASPGITFEDFLAKGGRRVDLKGSLEMKPPQVELK